MIKHKRLLPRHWQFRWWLVVVVILPLTLLGLYLVFSSHATNADINSDGQVNIQDLSILASNYGGSGKTFSQGDINGDGMVNVLDLSILASNWGTTVSTGPTYYLAPSGSDANPGTQAKPWKTFTASLPKLKPGDTLLARGGNYVEKPKLSCGGNCAQGSASSRITVRNYPGERPIIQGQLWIGYPSFWTIDGINVTWVSSNPDEPLVNLYGGTDWLLQNSEIWGNGNGVPTSNHGGLLVGDGSRNNLGRFTIRDNCIHDNETNMYFDDYSSSPDVSASGRLVERNIIYRSYDGRGIKLGPPTSGGPRDVTIRYNTIYDAQEMGGGGQGEDLSMSKQASNNVAYRNILVKAAEANVLGFELSGTGNSVHDNVGFAAPVFLSNTAGYIGISDGGGNLHLDPQFASINSCTGFHPNNATAQAYGRYAP